jgi:AGCS family alanine or glycine:cation symporter
MSLLKTIESHLWLGLIPLLILSGVYFSVLLGLPQIRYFFTSFRLIFKKERGGKKSLSAFQALCLGLAARVGTGNIAGVALALQVGGLGAIFWLWVAAIVGMVTSFTECSLAQLYKQRDNSGAFVGGPAYYIAKGLKSPYLAILMAISIIITYGFAVNAIQAQAIAESVKIAFEIPHWLIVTIFVVLIILPTYGGIKSIGRMAEFLVPFMALLYIAIAIYIIAQNGALTLQILGEIVASAIDTSAISGGIAGCAICELMKIGLKQGAFSNESGVGSVPNAAAMATASHPAKQGFIQMLGVFIDTIVICTATAIVIYIAQYQTSFDVFGESREGVAITQKAIEVFFPSSGKTIISIIVLLFAFTSVLANIAYATNNLAFFIKDQKLFSWLNRLVIAGIILACVWSMSQSIGLLWLLVGYSIALSVVINITALIRLFDRVQYIFKHFRANGIDEFSIAKDVSWKKQICDKTWQVK